MYRTSPDDFGDLHEADDTTSSAPTPALWDGFANAQPVLRESGLPEAVERIFGSLDTLGDHLADLRCGLDALDPPRH